MDNQVTQISYKAVQRYFKTLENNGYLDYGSVYKIVVLLFLEELLSGSIPMLVEEQDYDLIVRSLTCLANDCRIDLPDFDIYETMNKVNVSLARVTQEDDIRFADKDMRTQS